MARIGYTLRPAAPRCAVFFATPSGPKPCREPASRGSPYCLRCKHALKAAHAYITNPQKGAPCLITISPMTRPSTPPSACT